MESEYSKFLLYSQAFCLSVLLISVVCVNKFVDRLLLLCAAASLGSLYVYSFCNRIMAAFENLIFVFTFYFKNIMSILHNMDKDDKLYVVVTAYSIACVLCLSIPKIYKKIRRCYRKAKVIDGRLSQSFYEKMISGSDFQLNVTEPGFQVAIYGSIGGEVVPVGQGFWIDEGLITAAHVVQDFEEVVLRKNGCEMWYLRDDFVTLDGDLAVLKITAAQTQKLGLSKGKLSPLAIVPNGGLIAQIVAFGKRSAGFVDTYPQFGYCKFGGSTIGGFSGAPYYLNKQIFGMHLGGNLDNIGYEAAYIKSILKPSKTIKNHAQYISEDSDDWLIEQAGRVVEFAYDQSPYDPDEYRVKINNRYHVVSYDVLDRMQKSSKGQRRKDLVLDYESASTDLFYDAESLPLCPRGALNFKDSGNLIRAPAVIAGAPGQEPVQVNAPVPAPRISNSMASTSQIVLEPSHMESLMSTRAPPNGPSRTTVRKQKMRLKNQQLMKTVEQLSRRLEAMENGRQTSAQPPTSTSGLIPNLQAH